MAKYRCFITAKDWGEGRLAVMSSNRPRCAVCPVARAIGRRLGRPVAVTGSAIHLALPDGRPDYGQPSVLLSKGVAEAISDFDYNRPFRRRNFTIELPW